MADFEKAFEITMGHEGTYSDDVDDVGGETYRGISRRYNPNWNGWILIDEYKKSDFSVDEWFRIKGDEMNNLVFNFYKDRYWNPWWGDEIDDQSIANEMFDTSVNMGVGRAVKFLQKGLNCLNRNGILYLDIVEDGAFGNNTFQAYNSLPAKDLPVLCKIMNVLQGMHYINYMTKSPTQEKFARGWFTRVDFRKA